MRIVKSIVSWLKATTLLLVVTLAGSIISLSVSTDAVSADEQQPLPDLVIENAVIPQPPPGMMMAAGYMRLVNSGTTDITLLGAESEQFKKVELHLSAMKNDVATMIKQDSVVIPAGETVEFRHGDLHLMLMGVKSALTPGAEILLKLKTDQGDSVVKFQVQGKDAS